ncbi:MAG TPA: response regulator transcription factor [Polyangiaceae bacterium]
MSGSPAADGKEKKRILIAEDDESIATMLVRILGVRYEVHRAQDGKQALALADRIRPNLILLDVMMPGLDGYTTAQQIRMIPSLKNVSIIFLTAKGGAMDVVKGIQSGARFYVTKPFKMEDLLAKVKKALGE